MEKELTKFCCYVDGWNLTADGRVKLEQLEPEDQMFLPGPQAQYRLRSAEDYGPQVKFVSNYWVKSTTECKLYQLIILTILKLQSYNDIQFSGYKMTD